jgi:mannose-1-phosphate guanylyltransferase/mannose-6-phosphate isomerase
LWPVSRQLFPKQLLPLTGEQSLLQQTAKRVSGKPFDPAIIVSGEEQRFFIKRQLEAVGAPFEAILLEPMGRNTAAAAALAAAWLRTSGRDELMLLMPSDHVIGDTQAFVRAVETGVPHAEAGAIVTFGAQPTEPNTQYGYIEADTARAFGDGASPIARFVEKPDAATAAEYLESGRFLWNSGIFLMKAGVLLDEMREFLPEPRRDPALGCRSDDRQSLRPTRDDGLRRSREYLDRPRGDGEDRARRCGPGPDAMVRRRRLGRGVEAGGQGLSQ